MGPFDRRALDRPSTLDEDEEVSVFDDEAAGYRPGAAPGTLEIDPEAPLPRVTVIAYDEQRIVELADIDIDRLPGLIEEYAVTWIDVDGLGDAGLLSRLGELFDLHPLALEDVVHVPQRSKMEPYGDVLFLVAHMIERRDGVIDAEQLSLFLGQGWVLTLQERDGDCLGPVRERLHLGRQRLRYTGADYLAYALLDSVVDHGFPVLDQVEDELDELEDDVIRQRRHDDVIFEIQTLRSELRDLRRRIAPVRDTTASLMRHDTPLICDETRLFLRDCHDHSIRLVELLESLRERAASLTDLHLSMVGYQMNEIMKTLTIIATIFIPLSFIAGFYGMNFDPHASRWNMPELEWVYGYPFAVGLMVAVAVTLLIFFRRRGWIGRSAE